MKVMTFGGEYTQESYIEGKSGLTINDGLRYSY